MPGRKVRISVVTPSYNQGEYLEQTIRSVLSQEVEDLEYIVMDGGSTDGSVEIIRRYSNRLAHWESKPDGGQARAIRDGFEMCTGDVLCWLNSDDQYTSGTLAKVSRFFAEDEGLELLYGDYFLLYPDGRLIAKPKISYDFAICLSVFLMIPQPSAFWSRRIYDKVGGLNPEYRYALDYDLFLKMGRVLEDMPGAIRKVHDYWSVFRVHGGSKSVSEKRRFRMETERVRASHGFPRFWPYRRLLQYYQLARTLCRFHRERGFIPTGKEKGKA